MASACPPGKAMQRLATEAQRATPAVAPVRYRTLITTHDAARLAGNVEVSPRCSTARRSCARDCRCRCDAARAASGRQGVGSIAPSRGYASAASGSARCASSAGSADGNRRGGNGGKDRKRGGEGTGVSVSVDAGGRRDIKQKIKEQYSI